LGAIPIRRCAWVEMMEKNGHLGQDISFIQVQTHVDTLYISHSSGCASEAYARPLGSVQHFHAMTRLGSYIPALTNSVTLLSIALASSPTPRISFKSSYNSSSQSLSLTHQRLALLLPKLCPQLHVSQYATPRNRSSKPHPGPTHHISPTPWAPRPSPLES